MQKFYNNLPWFVSKLSEKRSIFYEKLSWFMFELKEISKFDEESLYYIKLL